jgi:HEAT repeat protein
MYSEHIIELIEELGHNDSTRSRQIRTDLVEKGEVVVKHLIPKLKSDDFSIVKDTLWILGKVKDSRAIKPIVQLLGDESTSIRKKAVNTLLSIGKEALLAFLEQLSSDEVVRRRISLWYLPEFNDPTIGSHL